MQNFSIRAPWIRVIAFLLAAVLLGFSFLYAMIALGCVSLGFFGGDPVFQTSWRCAELVRNRGYSIIEQYWRNPKFTHWDKLLSDSDLRFIILEEETGDVVASYLDGLGIQTPDNLADNPFLYQYDHVMSRGEYGTPLEYVYVCDYYFGEDWAAEVSWHQQTGQTEPTNAMVEMQTGNDVIEVPAPTEEMAAAGEPSYQILYILGNNLHYNSDSIGTAYRIFQYFRQQTEGILSRFAVCFGTFLLLVVFLLVQAGRVPDSTELRTTWFDRIPTDLMLAIALVAGIGLIGLAVLLSDTTANLYLELKELALVQVLTSTGAAACGMIIVLVLCSFSVRLKLGQFWQSALAFRAVVWCWKTGKRAVSWLWKQAVLGVRSIGMVPRAALTLLGVILVEFLLLVWLVNAWDAFFPLLLLLLFNLILLLALIWGFAQMRILQKAAKSLADGNLDGQLDTSRMYWEFKRQGEHLNAIAGGMNKAVEQRMRSERLKTELITNVSHDIKTPLTSIVNYVDLLQKPHTEVEQMQYLEVLDRQSKRLKKLTENLVEASKASTGTLPVALQPTSVSELLHQAVEEYRERLAAGKLEVVLDPGGELTVLADGKHMWRILNNLLNNVIKYAMPGTRVYVTARKQAEQVVIAVKNISRDPLNVDAEELMERFVRGDSARHTEGSGLGLNIARSLTALQHGEFTLTVDGDLFKAEIILPVA